MSRASRSPSKARLCGGPVDGEVCDHLGGGDIAVWNWAHVPPDRSLRLPRYGLYVFMHGEWSMIGDEKVVHYTWEGWQWGDDWISTD